MKISRTKRQGFALIPFVNFQESALGDYFNIYFGWLFSQFRMGFKKKNNEAGVGHKD